jgi:hypothetical protein
MANILNGPEIPTLYIDIGFRHLSKLHSKREEAMGVGYLVQGEDDFVPASIRYGRQAVDVKLRLKGDMLDHLRTDKWSLRIHTSNDQQLFGLRRFSLQHPVTRGFQYEVLFQKTLQRLGVLAPKYFFVKVVVNGDNAGVMALEEHFSKELLERHSRREGVIVRFDETLMWADRVARGRTAVLSQGPFDNYQNAPVSAFQSKKINASESLSRQYAVAAGLLRAFADGEIEASEAFDVEVLGRFLATAQLWGAWHATGWNNQRFYLNPLTMKLEPIGYDAHLQDRIASGSFGAPGTLMHRFLEDPEVLAIYQSTLIELADAVNTGPLLAELDDLQKDALRDLRTEFVFLQPIELEDLRARAEDLVRELDQPETMSKEPGPFGAHVLAYTVKDKGRTFLELSNPLPHAIEIQSIQWVGPKLAAATFEPLARIAYPLVLAPIDPEGERRSILIEYLAVPIEGEAWLEIRSTIKGHSTQMVAKSRVGFLPLQENPLPKADLESLVAQQGFLTLSHRGDTILVTKGRWQVNDSIVIPRDYGLQIPGGTTLQFGPNASLVTYGRTYFEGTKEEPIVLEGISDTGNGRWPGIVVHDSPDRSVWSYVTVRDTAGVRRSAWEPTGGTTFYKSDVTMSYCTFVGNQAEDALNIVRAAFELIEVDFLRTASDALDIDYSSGSIRGGSFQDIGLEWGADGLDFSGSEATVDGVRFERVGDKAISVGEGSLVTASNLNVEECGIGAASKDGSTLKLTDSTLSNANIAGLMSYVKKPEYGTASLIATNIKITNTAAPTVVQHGSRIERDGKLIVPQYVDVEALYQSVNIAELH